MSKDCPNIKLLLFLNTSFICINKLVFANLTSNNDIKTHKDAGNNKQHNHAFCRI